MKISPKIAVLNRIERMRRIVETDTQRIRLKMIKMLEEIFNMASAIAKGEVQYQTVDGKPVRVTLKQRQMWVRVAAYTAQVMNTIASSFDEREIDEMLKTLRGMVDEAKAKVGVPEDAEGDAEEEGSASDPSGED